MGIHSREKYIVLGLDPGRDKMGFAFVDGRGILSAADTFAETEGRLIVSGIFPSGESDRFFAAVRAYAGDVQACADGVHEAGQCCSGTLQQDSCALSEWLIEKFSLLPEDLPDSIMLIAIGNGTHSKDFTARVKAAFSCEVLTVDERNTTLEARGLYWKIHAPGFLMRLIPEGLRVPARVLDDLAAWVIAVRGLKKYRDINQNKL